MKSSNCSLTFSGRAGAFPGWPLGERGLIQAPRELYRQTPAGFKEKPSLTMCCLVGTALLCTPPGTGCSETWSTSLRRGWESKVRKQGYTTGGCSCQHHGAVGCGGHSPNKCHILTLSSAWRVYHVSLQISLHLEYQNGSVTADTNISFSSIAKDL